MKEGSVNEFQKTGWWLVYCCHFGFLCSFYSIKWHNPVVSWKNFHSNNVLFQYHLKKREFIAQIQVIFRFDMTQSTEHSHGTGTGWCLLLSLWIFIRLWLSSNFIRGFEYKKTKYGRDMRNLSPEKCTALAWPNLYTAYRALTRYWETDRKTTNTWIGMPQRDN